MSRKAIYSMLTTDARLHAIGMTSATTYGSATMQSPSEQLFTVLKYGDDTAFLGMLSTQSLEVWVYDMPGSYSRINNVIDIVKQILTVENVDVVDEDGGRFSQARWMSTSRELYDDIYKRVTRFATFNVV